MRIAVLSSYYPDPEGDVGGMFVHVRAREYQERGAEVEVFKFFLDRPSYAFEGVPVSTFQEIEAMRARLREFDPDVIAIHFYQGWMLQKLIELIDKPFVVCIHGVEALWWFRRLFNLEWSREFRHYVAYNVIQMVRLRQLVTYANRNPSRVSFVFVSDWMRKIMETDVLKRVERAHIIPNPIDTERFAYVPKPPEQRTNVLVIRNFASRKYANDLSVKSILKLSERADFGDFRFTIAGRGKLFEELTAPLRGFDNVTLINEFLFHEDVVALHRSHGVFLCPTRQDSQGVSMCEAMASGLVPVTSHNTAIPEFVQHEVSGFLTRSAEGLAEAMVRVKEEPSIFSYMSDTAAGQVRALTGAEHVISRELELFETVA